MDRVEVGEEVGGVEGEELVRDGLGRRGVFFAVAVGVSGVHGVAGGEDREMGEGP